MAETVVGLFDSPEQAQSAVNDIAQLGIPRDRISIVAKSGDRVTKGTAATTEGGHTEAGKGAGIGAATGAVVGGVAGAAGWLAALGLAAIPGIGPLLAAGPIMAALAGAGIGAAAGGITGALIGMGIPEEDAEVYEEGVHRGGTLVTVETDASMADRVGDIMTRDGAVDIDRRAAEWQASGWKSRYDRSRANTGTAQNQATGQAATQTSSSQAASRGGREERIPVVEEQLKVGKRTVQGGGVRIYRRATEQPVEANVRLNKETVKVERRAADRPASAQDLQGFKEGAVEVTETREEPVVQKEARVTGEVVVRKENEQRTETVRDTVRKTDVDVQRTNERNENRTP